VEHLTILQRAWGLIREEDLHAAPVPRLSSYDGGRIWPIQTWDRGLYWYWYYIISGILGTHDDAHNA
jgi:hypothetical protein